MYIRALEQRDIQDVRGILEQGKPYVASYNEYVYWILGKYFSDTCLVAESDGSILGYIGGLYSEETKTIFVWQIAVSAKSRGQKIGRALLNAVFSRARERNINKIDIAIDNENMPCRHMVENLVSELGYLMAEKEVYEGAGFHETVYTITLS